jgi:hypothetical protein
VDIIQAKHYIKINNPTYIKKIINEHAWMIDKNKTQNMPIPMSEDKQYLKQLEEATPPEGENKQCKLQIQMKFNY